MQTPNHRAACQQSRPKTGQQESSGPLSQLSVTVFWEQQRKSDLRLCQTNCRAIEVPVIYPVSSLSHFLDEDDGNLQERSEPGIEAKTGTGEMATGQLDHGTNPNVSCARDDNPSTAKCDVTFPLLRLPLELRLKIYGYLLPAKTHTIVTQVPHNGFFYNTNSIPSHSARRFYPFGTKAPNNLTTYKVLDTSFRTSFPVPSVFPEILRVCRQVREEAEPVLYGSSEALWDFGIHLEALGAFWGDRSENARKLVRNVRLATEIPCLAKYDGTSAEADSRWTSVCSFLTTELTGLRALDLTIWSNSGSVSSFPISTASASLPPDVAGDWESERAAQLEIKEQEIRKWREWKWTADLLQMGSLRQARITWWGFQTLREDGDGGFDSWLAGRMVGDGFVRRRIIGEGVVDEGAVLLRTG